jgi:hypothetical protein
MRRCSGGKGLGEGAPISCSCSKPAERSDGVQEYWSTEPKLHKSQVACRAVGWAEAGPISAAPTLVDLEHE